MKLTGFLMKLSGEQLIVELKNGTVVLGTVIGTDVAMNMHLRVVTLTAKGKNPVRMDALSIRGSNVRYVMCVFRGRAATAATAAAAATGLLALSCPSTCWRPCSSSACPHATSRLSPLPTRPACPHLTRSLPDSLNLDVLLVDDTQRVKPVKEAAPTRGRGGRGGRGGMRGRGRGM
jgi:small nuclear ribonucleoprotein (snRNP)-like protein